MILKEESVAKVDHGFMSRSILLIKSNISHHRSIQHLHVWDFAAAGVSLNFA